MTTTDLVSSASLPAALRSPDEPGWRAGRCEIAADRRTMTVEGWSGETRAVALVPGRGGVLAVPFVPSRTSAAQIVGPKVRPVPIIDVVRTPPATLTMPGPIGGPPRLEVHPVRLRAIEGTALRLDTGRMRVADDVAVIGLGDEVSSPPLLVELRPATDGDGTVARLADPTAATAFALAQVAVRLVLQSAARPARPR